MSKYTIWHNPRCSKSRQTLALLEERGVTPEIVRYLDAPPTPERLGQVIAALGLNPQDLMRKKEAAYRELGLAEGRHSREEEIRLMCANPSLIERPVVICAGRAVVGRPPTSVLTLLDE